VRGREAAATASARPAAEHCSAEAPAGAEAYGRYLPVALRMDGRAAVIVGGDREAEAKMEKLLRCRARVTVVAPEVTAQIERRAAEGSIRLRRRGYRNGDLAGARLAFCSELDSAAGVRAEADRSGILLNVVDRIEQCDFSAVAYVERDGLQLAVHSSGKSAALARRIRERLERDYGEEFEELLCALGKLRGEVKRILPSAGRRRELWLEAVDERLLEEVAGGGFDRPGFEARVRLLAEESSRRHSGENE
jgi:precorrin-2 dehydrogenase